MRRPGIHSITVYLEEWELDFISLWAALETKKRGRHTSRSALARELLRDELESFPGYKRTRIRKNRR